MTKHQKDALKKELVDRLSREPEVRRIVIFGSFLDSAEPYDMDVAVFQDSPEAYPPLAMKYRRITSPLAHKISLDTFSLRSGMSSDPSPREAERGQAVDERSDEGRVGL